MNFVSHTLVRNGMPYIDLVLRQVIPFANRCLITISEKSNDGTLQVLRKLEKDFPEKIRIDFENVKEPGLLTQERQKQVDKTSEDWILFLDSDDLWSEKSLKEIITLINRDEDVDAYTFTPYQVVDENLHDDSWRHKSFTKLFRNGEINYRKEWPKDLIFKGERSLYWRECVRTKKIPIRYFHLSNLMKWRFRDEKWAEEYRSEIGNPIKYPLEVKKELHEILDKLNSYL